jgi:Ca2+-binding EF-hand superfamily protein
MASFGTGDSYLQSVLQKHRLVFLSVTGAAIACTLLYVNSSRTSRQPPPLHRRNAVHRRGRQPPIHSNHSAEPLSHDLSDNVGSDTRDIEGGVETLADVAAETEVGISQPAHATASSSLKELVYCIAEESSRQRAYIHRGISCSECPASPIRGIRWRCSNCVKYDLCSDCEATTIHTKSHVFQKIKIPIPSLLWDNPNPLLYPGDLQEYPWSSLPKTVLRTLLDSTKYEMEELEAFFDEFLVYANQKWPDDPNGIGVAMNDKAFEKAWMPKFRNGASPPNILCDRIFNYYDSDKNDLVGFVEFVQGIAALRGKSRKRQDRARIVFDAFDLDKDGYISRKDILRVFKGYYQLQKRIILEELDQEMVMLVPSESESTIYSTRPLNGMLNSRQSVPFRENQQNKPSGAYQDELSHGSALASDEEAKSHRGNAQRMQDLDLNHSAVSEQVSIEGLDDSSVRERQERYRIFANDQLVEASGSEESLLAKDSDFLFDTEKTHVEAMTTKLRENARRITDADSSSTVSQAQTPSNRPDQHGQDIHGIKHGLSLSFKESNLAKEVIYLLLQESINQFLDPLFKRQEKLALEAEKGEREDKKGTNNSMFASLQSAEAQETKQSEPLPAVGEQTGLPTEAKPSHLDQQGFSDVDGEIQVVQVAGSLEYEEFEKLSSMDDSKRFNFLSSWLELGNF